MTQKPKLKKKDFRVGLMKFIDDRRDQIPPEILQDVMRLRARIEIMLKG